ncbi:hypothetical protein ACP4OV_011223 [Aristida adscensionis]
MVKRWAWGFLCEPLLEHCVVQLRGRGNMAVRCKTLPAPPIARSGPARPAATLN